LAAANALITAARWVSARRTSTFERLFPPDPLQPDEPARTERLSVAQAGNLLIQLRGALTAAAVGSDAARRDGLAAPEVRSAPPPAPAPPPPPGRSASDPRPRAAAAPPQLFRLADGERAADPTARPALRAHVIFLLQIRGPALKPGDKSHALTLLRTLTRGRP